MAISFAAALGVHDQALGIRSARAEILAGNIVNADTPGYKATDIDFQAALTQKMDVAQRTTLAKTHARHLGRDGADGDSHERLYRIPHQPAIDGNTVDLQIEQAEFAKNALDFQTSFTFLNSKIRGLRNAIRGE